MRGKWLAALIAGVAAAEISLRDAFNLTAARITLKPVNISFSKVLFPNADHVLWSLVADTFVNKVYAPPGFEIHSNDIVVDIGAHKGVFIAYAAQRTKNEVRGFEPDQGNFSYLKSLVAKHGWAHVKLVNAAITDQPDGEVQLYTAASSSRNSILRKDVVFGDQLTKSRPVASQTLEGALSNLPYIDFLKMDCEGAEFQIFNATSQSTISKIGKIAMEYHSPIDSREVQELASRFKDVFSNVMVSHIANTSLGYIYAN